MKAVVLALSLSVASAFSELELAAPHFRTDEQIKQNKVLDLPRVNMRAGVVGSLKTMASQALDRVKRGAYVLYSEALDDDKWGKSSQWSGLCDTIQSKECFSDSFVYFEGTDSQFTISPCATCAYGPLGTVSNSSQCYTCPKGYTLLTNNPGPDNIYAAFYDCTGICVPDAEADNAIMFAWIAFNATFADVEDTDNYCMPYGTKYPEDCSPSDDEATCFSGMDTVQLESGETKALSEVQVGDRVLSADAQGALSYSDVVFLPHSANNKAATFVNIVTEGGKALKATKTHLVQTCSGELAYAGALKTGDCLRTADGEDLISATSVTKAEGIYSVVAQNEFVVVSGVVASPFAFAHGATNAVYNMHRALYKVAPALLKSSAVVSANAALGSAAVFAAGLFAQAK